MAMCVSRRTVKGVASEDSLVRRISRLRAERERLEEEIVQLRAAVLIWTEVVRRTATPPEPAKNRRCHAA
jgi:methylmalonyl-CoA mutase N-terminal domain/subunit